MEMSYESCAIVCRAKAQMIRIRLIGMVPTHYRYDVLRAAVRHLEGYAVACQQAAVAIAHASGTHDERVAGCFGCVMAVRS